MNTTLFSTLLAKCSSEEELNHFLSGILTVKELSDLENRLAILQALIDGETQRKVTEDLGVGIATVTRGAKALQDEDFKKLLKGLLLKWNKFPK